MVVREDVPGRRLKWASALVALVFLAAITGWTAGRHVLLVELAGGQDAGGVDLLARLSDENRALRDELAVSGGSRDLSLAVEERLRGDNRELQDRVAELEQAVAYYRRVVVPDTGGKGLRIERAEIVPGEAPGTWTLALVLVRTGETDGTLQGQLEGSLLADGPQGRIALPLARVLPAPARGFSVRYVAESKTDLSMPAGLVPVRLDLAAVLTAPRADRVTRSWQRANNR